MGSHPASANVFLIGAQKSGTTYLASLLDAHPDVCVSDPKEPQFFSSCFDQGFDFYAECFATPDAPVRLDASTTYTFLRPRHALGLADAPGLMDPVPERISDACPDARFIYIMRDPIKRMMSAVRHQMRNDPDPAGQSVSLLKAVEANPMLLLVSRYADQIDRYLDVFDPSRFLFLDFEALKSAPEIAVAQTCTFMGISTDQIDLSAQAGEKHAAYRYTPFGRMMQEMEGTKNLLRRAVPKKMKDWAKASLLTAPIDVTFTDTEEVAQMLADDRARLPALTGLTI